MTADAELEEVLDAARITLLEETVALQRGLIAKQDEAAVMSFQLVERLQETIRLLQETAELRDERDRQRAAQLRLLARLFEQDTSMSCDLLAMAAMLDPDTPKGEPTRWNVQ